MDLNIGLKDIENGGYFNSLEGYARERMMEYLSDFIKKWSTGEATIIEEFDSTEYRVDIRLLTYPNMSRLGCKDIREEMMRLSSFARAHSTGPITFIGYSIRDYDTTNGVLHPFRAGIFFFCRKSELPAVFRNTPRSREL